MDYIERVLIIYINNSIVCRRFCCNRGAKLKLTNNTKSDDTFVEVKQKPCLHYFLQSVFFFSIFLQHEIEKFL